MNETLQTLHPAEEQGLNDYVKAHDEHQAKVDQKMKQDLSAATGDATLHEPTINGTPVSRELPSGVTIKAKQVGMHEDMAPSDPKRFDTFKLEPVTARHDNKIG